MLQIEKVTLTREFPRGQQEGPDHIVVHCRTANGEVIDFERTEPAGTGEAYCVKFDVLLERIEWRPGVTEKGRRGPKAETVTFTAEELKAKVK